MIHMGIDLPSSSQHSLPMPRGAPTLNHIGAQQLSLWNWVLMAFVVRITICMVPMMMMVARIR